MALPIADELVKRKKTAEEQLRRLQEASHAFFKVWDEIEQEEKSLTHQLSAYVDKEKLKRIHDTINSSQ